MKEIIAEFNPHKGYTVSIRVVVPVARRVTGMFYGFLLGTVSHSKWRETDVRDTEVSLHDFGSFNWFSLLGRAAVPAADRPEGFK